MTSSAEIAKKYRATPFLRWTGSKAWLAKEGIERFLPKSFGAYHEPFLGGGSVFFSLEENGRNEYLTDSNKDLIEAYSQIRDNVDQVISSLQRLKNTKDDYYRIRGQRCQKPHTRAARFIYLNRCSFNGIYRVNSWGGYNVPYGWRKNVDIVTEQNLRAVSQRLQRVHLNDCDFSESLEQVGPGDLVFLDPPYTVAHENNGFIEYNQKLFSWDDQERLRNLVELISAKGAYFILSNASHKSILDLYKGIGEISVQTRKSKVGGRNKTRGLFRELIICNTR